MTADEASRTEALLAFPSEEGEGRTPPSPISDSTETIDPEGLLPRECDSSEESSTRSRILDVTGYQFNRQSDRPQQLRILVVESYEPSVALETALTGNREPDPVIDHGHDSPDVEVVMPMDSTGVGRFDLPLKRGPLEAIAQHASVPSQPMRSMFAGLVGIYSRIRRFTGTQLHGASETFCRMHQQTARAMCRS